jgi:hypothetical protein
MSKLQMAQVYAASVMFGYFLRRVDKRFQLAKSLGMLPEDKEDVVARLGRIFSLVSCNHSVECKLLEGEGRSCFNACRRFVGEFTCWVCLLLSQ